MSYSIIIPSNVGSKLRKCIGSILKTHRLLDPSKIIVIDDGARNDWTDADPKVTWVDGIRPFIYARNVNLGIASCTDDVVIIGDDVLIESEHGFDWLQETSKRATAKTWVAAVSAGIIGPVGNRHQVKRGNTVRESPIELCFVCIYIPRKAINAVGLLDERFVHYGCEDIDWSWRAQALSGRLLIDERCAVLHNEIGMPSAFRDAPDIGLKSTEARKLLHEKWPDRC